MSQTKSLAVTDREKLLRIAKARHALHIKEHRRLQSDPHGGLHHFVRYFWHVLEPNKQFVDGWVLHAICQHLEAVTRGEIKRLLINVPPGFMKSLLVNVFWPAWEWSAMGMAHLRYVSFSYSSHLTERDNGRFRDILRSKEFQELWGHVFQLTEDGKIKVANTQRGWKFASSVKGVGTGERGDRVLLDDPTNVKEGESEAVRSETNRWIREGMSNRLNDMINDAIVAVMQRVHAEDASNQLISEGLEYVHLMVPMEYDPSRHCGTVIGWSDPREEDGELAWPERFPDHVVGALKRTLGPYAYTGQYQQNPEPRGGGILKRDWWGVYELELGAQPRHAFEYVIASLDPAFTSKQENDPSGFVVLGVYREMGRPKVVLLHAWKKWLELHGRTIEREHNEDTKKYIRRAMPEWGLVEWVAHDCRRLRVNQLLIEDKASGHSVAQEIKRLYFDKTWGVSLVNPGTLDKRARAYAVQHMFADGMIEAPASTRGEVYEFREFAQMAIDECVVAGTKIITRVGLKNVEDIRPGDEVLTHMGRFRPVLATSQRKANALVTLAAKTLDPITLTPNHPLFALDVDRYNSVVSIDWVPAGDVVTRAYKKIPKGDKFYNQLIEGSRHAATIPKITPESVVDEIDLRDFASGMGFEVIWNDEHLTSSHFKIRAIKWRQKLDRAFGRICGLYLAEGSSRRTQVSWSFNARETHLVQEVLDFVEQRLGVGVFVRTQNNCSTVVMNAPLIDAFFTEFGKYAHEKVVPSWMWDAPDEFVDGLVSGWSEGDGYEADNGITVTTTSQSLAWGMRLMCLRLGLFATVRMDRAATEMTIEGRTYATKDAFTIQWKKERKRPGVAIPFEGGVGYSVMSTQAQDVSDVDVFNMEVLEDESYCTTGGMVHNCAKFRGLPGDEDNVVDALTQALKYIRDRGIAQRADEVRADEEFLARHKPKSELPYDV